MGKTLGKSPEHGKIYETSMASMGKSLAAANPMENTMELRWNLSRTSAENPMDLAIFFQWEKSEMDQSERFFWCALSCFFLGMLMNFGEV